MKKLLSMLLAVLMVVGMFPMTAFAAEVPEELNIAEISAGDAFEKGEVFSYTQWGSEGSAQSWIVTVPEGTETVKVTFKSDKVPSPYNDWQSGDLVISGGWFNENTGVMGGKELPCDKSSGNPAVTLDVKSMIENKEYYGVYNTGYSVQYLLGFKYGEAAAETGAKITLSTDAGELEIGDTFNVVGELSGNEGFASMKISLEWNEDAVKFNGFKTYEEDGEEILESDVLPASYAPTVNHKAGIITCARTKDSTKNGVIFTAEFEVIGNGYSEIALIEEWPDFELKTSAAADVEVSIDDDAVYTVGAAIKATSVTLDITELSLEEGASKIINATVAPEDTTQKVVFTSSDETIATVSSIGKVTAVKAGTATITAKAGDVSAECAVTVTPEANIIKKSPNNYSDFVEAEMTGVKSIQFNGETIDVRNIYKVTLAGHEECYIQCTKSDFSNSHVGYKLDGTHAMGDQNWGTGFSSMRLNGANGYSTKEYLVSYDDLKAAVGEENMDKLGVTEEDKLAVLVFKKVGASFNYVILFDIDPVALEGISIDEKAEIDKDSTKELKVTFIPSGAEEVVTWKSSDESVATVDENGVVTAVKNGKATITATAGEFSDTCEVTVRTSIKIIPSNGDYRGRVNGIYVYDVEVDGYKWEDKTVTVYVDKNTNATATVIFNWFHSYNQNQVSTYEVEVKNGEGYLDEFREYGDWVVKFAPTIPTTTLAVESEATIVKGYEKTLTVSRNEGATDMITWSSSDESIATVDANGKVKAIAEGKATITVKSGDCEASCEVTVILVHAKSVTIVGDGIENGKLRVLKGKQIQLSEVTEPAEHTDEIKWSSSNTEALSVLEWAPGYFNAIAPGTSTVTVTVGEVSDSIEVEVYEAPVEKITLDKTEATILTVESLILNATTDPEEHTDGNAEWSSSDETVATVGRGAKNTGTVTPVGVGEAIITAKVGNVSATCKVTVKEPEENTVIWEYDGNSMNGWPQNMSTIYGIGALVMNGAKYDSVAEENGVYTVTLPHATAKDAEISLKVYACGAYPDQLGVNWHEGEENPQSWNNYANELEHTVKLVDGEATVKVRAYKASGAGASREGTKTFKFVVDGECVFDQKTVAEEHLISKADCENVAVYYMSCACGKNGTDTFTDGEALGHDMKETEAAKEATCEEAGKTALLTCANGCGKTEGGEEIPATGHTFDQKAVTEDHLVSKADCENAAVYYMSCACGKNGTETFTDGEALGHKYSGAVTKEPNCSEKGETTYTCENCQDTYTEDIEIDADAHKAAEEWTSENGKHYHACENGCGKHLDETECSGGEATCTEKAECKECGKEYGEIDDEAHTLKYEIVKNPTCTEAGERKITCEDGCGHEVTETIEALGHNWSAWETVKEATKYEEGLEKRVCDRCDEAETKVLQKIRDNESNIIIDMTGKGQAGEESNPNTGAPVFNLTAAGIVVLAAAALTVGKLKKR